MCQENIPTAEHHDCNQSKLFKYWVGYIHTLLFFLSNFDHGMQQKLTHSDQAVFFQSTSPLLAGMCKIAHFLVLSWILLDIFCFSHHSLWTLEMVVQENCRSAVSEVLGPARLTPTNTAATVWKDETNCRKLKKKNQKTQYLCFLFLPHWYLRGGGVVFVFCFLLRSNTYCSGEDWKHIRHKWALV